MMLRRAQQRGAARAAAVIVLILVLVAGGGFLYLRAEQRRAIAELEEERTRDVEAIREEAREAGKGLALDIGRILAVTLADEVATVENAFLDLQLASVVRGERIAAVIVLDPSGAVLATTDLRYAGRTLDDPTSIRAMNVQEVSLAERPPAPGQVEVNAPIRSAGERVGTLRAFIELGPLTGEAGRQD